MTDPLMLARIFGLIRIDTVMSRTEGDPDLVIGIIDGPIDSAHPDFSDTRFVMLNNASGCLLQTSMACRHGTFVTGMLAGKRGTQAPALAPKCGFVLYPIFCESELPGNSCPQITSTDLADAVIKVIEAGANVINLSMGLVSGAIQPHPRLDEAFDYALQRGVIVVGASGNQGRIGYLPLFNHNWVIPVAMCDMAGQPVSGSNLGLSVGGRGLLSPGAQIPGLASGGGYMTMTGTSIAAPFVTGAAALLWSLFPDATANQIKRAILMSGVQRKSIVPPLLNVEAAKAMLVGQATAGRYAR